MTPAYGSLYSLQFYHLSLCLDAPRNFLVGAGEGHCHKNPIVAMIIRNYPLSFNGASAVNVYPLQNDSPLPIGGLHWCVPLGLCGKLLTSPPCQHDATRGLCRFLPVCPCLPFSFRQGSKEGCGLQGFKSPCFLTASPPISLTIYNTIPYHGVYSTFRT